MANRIDEAFDRSIDRQPDKTVVNVMGDAAFGIVGMDFETTVRKQVPILTIVLSSEGMSTYFQSTPSASDLSGDCSKIAEELGGYSERVENSDEIAPRSRRLRSL